MNRLLASFVFLGGLASAQTPAGSPPLVAKKAINEPSTTNMVTPNSVAPDTSAIARHSPDMLALPAGKATLLGGTIQTVDHMRDRLVLKVFGGDRTTVLFDERTRIFRGDHGITLDDLKSGERVYVDTMLDGTDVFAKNIRIATQSPMGESNGQIVAFDAATGQLTLRDALSPENVEMRVAPNTLVLRGDHSAPPTDLKPGTLVALMFSPGVGKTPTVQRVSILASPGSDFVFSGRVEHLDLHRGLIVLVDPRDNRSHEVYFDPQTSRVTRDLRQGSSVTIQASFDGTHYQSRNMTVIPTASLQ